MIYLYAYMHQRTFVHVHTHIYIYICTRACPHTHACTLLWLFAFPVEGCKTRFQSPYTNYKKYAWHFISNVSEHVCCGSCANEQNGGLACHVFISRWKGAYLMSHNSTNPDSRNHFHSCSLPTVVSCTHAQKLTCKGSHFIFMSLQL